MSAMVSSVLCRYRRRTKNILIQDNSFNCLLPAFNCTQFAECRPHDGLCECPPGFGGVDCKEPVCGGLADGVNRPLRKEGEKCKCKDGWSGINCNVCESDDACNPLMPEGVEGVCYKGGITVKQNFQQCKVTNRKILDMLEGKIPEVTFKCNAADKDCGFQCKAECDNFCLL